MDQSFTFTRTAALDHLAAAAPRLGHAYTTGRNTDAGPGREPTTTALSPYLRRRLLLEEEVVAAALAAHGPHAAGKLIDEVFWRSYFKGHLETHPAAWTGFLAASAQEQARLATNSGLRGAHDAAIAGRTGIDGFDDWARELVDTGWLHNHARMWFASIWIFTLRLPWPLGAAFFMRHLLDGDPASNTLSWRWVAGLHTRGKAYAATAENIRRYTEGRFSPTELNEHPEPLDEADPPRTVPLPPTNTPPPGDVALLLHGDDLHPESLVLGAARVVRVAGTVAHAPGADARVRAANEAAMADAMARAAAHFGCMPSPALPGWNDALPIVTAWAPVGPSADTLPSGCLRIRRHWDELAWPRSTKGFYRVKTAIPAILRELSLE